jgi:hypothetical protein
MSQINELVENIKMLVSAKNYFSSRVKDVGNELIEYSRQLDIKSKELKLLKVERDLIIAKMKSNQAHVEVDKYQNLAYWLDVNDIEQKKLELNISILEKKAESLRNKILLLSAKERVNEEKLASRKAEYRKRCDLNQARQFLSIRDFV